MKNPWTQAIGVIGMVLAIASLLPYLIGLSQPSYDDEARDGAFAIGNMLVMSAGGFGLLWMVVNALTWKAPAEA